MHERSPSIRALPDHSSAHRAPRSTTAAGVPPGFGTVRGATPGSITVTSLLRAITSRRVTGSTAAAATDPRVRSVRATTSTCTSEPSRTTTTSFAVCAISRSNGIPALAPTTSIGSVATHSAVHAPSSAAAISVEAAGPPTSAVATTAGSATGAPIAVRSPASIGGAVTAVARGAFFLQPAVASAIAPSANQVRSLTPRIVRQNARWNSSRIGEGTSTSSASRVSPQNSCPGLSRLRRSVDQDSVITLASRVARSFSKRSTLGRT